MTRLEQVRKEMTAACPRCAAVGINGCEHGFEVLCFPCSEWDGHGVRVDGEANT